MTSENARYEADTEASKDRRSRVRVCLDKGDDEGAVAELLRGLPALHPSVEECNQVDKLAEEIDFRNINFPTVRIAFLGSHTLDTLIPILKTKGYQSSVRIEEYVGGFHSWQVESVKPDSPLYSFDSDIIFLILRSEDICSKLVFNFEKFTHKDRQKEMDRLFEDLYEVLTALRSRTKAKIVITSLTNPQYLPDDDPSGRISLFAKMKERLLAEVSSFDEAWVIDMDEIQNRVGRNEWFDYRMWSIAKQPLSVKAMQALTDKCRAFVRAGLGLSKKCLVLDLDNTLWGGVLGEDGLDGIELGPEGPGSDFVDFQKAILELYNQGVMLALNSKNNEEDVIKALEDHPYMVLRPSHFAAMRVNWSSKVENMKELAKELNIGLDSMVFIDDSSFECSQMSEMLPTVETVFLGKESSEYTATLMGLGAFDFLTLSIEDKQRGEMYKAQAQRKILKEKVRSVEEFYESLDMEINIHQVGSETLGRAAQMTQKTNQFNLTTKRYSKTDIAALMEKDNYRLFLLHLHDRFGDNGNVGLIITHKIGCDVEIDTFLLSCRVIGRTVEDAFLTFLLAKLRDEGIKKVVGVYRPTKKNGQVEDFYKRHGFILQDSNDEQSSRWVLECSSFQGDYARYLRVNVDVGGH